MKAASQSKPIRQTIKPGDTFGQWTVVSFHAVVPYGNHGCKKPLWICRCNCPNHTERLVNQYRLHSGKSRSCGCLTRSHGESYHATPEYKAWDAMLQRCYNPFNRNYPYYGARGISVCSTWRKSFSNFLADMGRRPSKRHSLNRINNNQNYYPYNCEWAIPFIQNSNKSNTKFVNGIPLPILAHQYNIKLEILRCRLKRGWDLQRALSTPPLWLRKQPRLIVV